VSAARLNAAFEAAANRPTAGNPGLRKPQPLVVPATTSNDPPQWRSSDGPLHPGAGGRQLRSYAWVRTNEVA